MNPWDVQSKSIYDENGVTNCLCSGDGKEIAPCVLTDGDKKGAAVPPVAFGICSKDSNAMKSDNPNSGFYEADTSRTLDANGGNPNCNQGGMAVVAIEGNGARPLHKGDGFSDEGVSYTLNSVEQHGVAYGIDRAAFNQGRNAQYNISIEEEKNSSLVARGPSAVAYSTTTGARMIPMKEKTDSLCARDYKDGQIVAKNNSTAYCARPGNQIADYAETEKSPPEAARDYKDPMIVTNDIDYIVRRLTPTECARLQGFPDWWCDGIAVPEPTEDDMRFWRGVFDTYCDINGQKHKTDNQIRKWLADPHTDSAEYKMWGNGCALPNVYYVMFGIAEEMKSSGDV